MRNITIHDDNNNEMVFTECQINIYKLEKISKDLLQVLELVNTNKPIYEEKGNTESSSIYILDYANTNLEAAPTAYVYIRIKG